jgi:hypothetical protein
MEGLGPGRGIEFLGGERGGVYARERGVWDRAQGAGHSGGCGGRRWDEGGREEGRKEWKEGGVIRE